MLSPEEERHLLLESYKEQTVSWKHHDLLTFPKIYKYYPSSFFYCTGCPICERGRF